MDNRASNLFHIVATELDLIFICIRRRQHLYADDIVFFANTPEELQPGLDLLTDLLTEYCKRWKLTINVSKTKVLVFRKGSIRPRNISFTYYL